MCNKGYNLTFHDKGCEIIKGNLGKLVVEGTKTDGNVYHLKEANGRSCLMAQTSECWLWHKMDHIKFDNMVKIKSTHAVRDMP